jgi:hypothetical protein
LDESGESRFQRWVTSAVRKAQETPPGRRSGRDTLPEPEPSNPSNPRPALGVQSVTPQAVDSSVWSGVPLPAPPEQEDEFLTTCPGCLVRGGCTSTHASRPGRGGDTRLGESRPLSQEASSSEGPARLETLQYKALAPSTGHVGLVLLSLRPPLAAFLYQSLEKIPRGRLPP